MQDKLKPLYIEKIRLRLCGYERINAAKEFNCYGELAEELANTAWQATDKTIADLREALKRTKDYISDPRTNPENQCAGAQLVIKIAEAALGENNNAG